MGYNRVNKLKQYMLIVNITKKHYVEGVTTYRGIWACYINPVYPMTYQSYMRIINMPNLERQLREAEEKREQGKQLTLFE